MKDHILNLYKIENVNELNFSYKLVTFDLSYIANNEELLNKQLHKIAESVSSLTMGPAAIVKRNGKPFVAIPSDRHMADFAVQGNPFVIPVTLGSHVHKIDSKNIANQDLDVIHKFLDYEIRNQLSASPHLWKLNTHQFFQKAGTPGPGNSGINIHHGFTFRLVRLQDDCFYICLDLSTKYIGNKSLSHYVNEKNVRSVEARFKGRRFLYLNKDNWYTIELVGFGQTINDQDFIRDGKAFNVYQYILDNSSGSRNVQNIVKPNDLSIFYQYPGRSMEPHSGASSLAKILYSTDDDAVKSLHKLSIKKPTPRFELIGKYVTNYFMRLRFNRTPLRISGTPLVEKVKNFNIPDLLFNNNQRLKVGESSVDLAEFARRRKQVLLNQGIINNTSFDEQYLIVPDQDYLDSKLVEAFKNNAEAQIKKLAPNFKAFKVIRYAVKSDTSATVQIAEIEKVLHRHNAKSGFALFLLPDLSVVSKNFLRNFHECLKNKFYPGLKVQCASSNKVKGFFDVYPGINNSGLIEFKVINDLKPKFRSYLFNLVMEHLIVNRKWPYSLAKQPTYDVYIGIDVHGRYAGFTFFFKNGQNIIFYPHQVPKSNKSQRSEKLGQNLIYQVILDKLKTYLPLYAPNANGIAIIRDGKSFGVEYKALEAAINSLAEENLVDKTTIKYGVIDLHKQSALPLRLATKTNGHEAFVNPISGAYKLISESEGFLYSTGYPFQVGGSVRPLQLSLKEGNLDFLKVMEDIFGQVMLAFSAPDKSNFLPVTIKLIDSLLEPLAATSDISDSEEEEILKSNEI